jgi:hypothetical protein
MDKSRIDRRYVVSGDRRYDRRAIRERNVDRIPETAPGDRPASRGANSSLRSARRTASARTRIDRGTARPSALAVLRFTAISYFVAAGFRFSLEQEAMHRLPIASASLAAKEATTAIPIVFRVGADPVEVGLVASLNRPGGNLTGLGGLSVEVTPKRLELLHELIPTAKIVALLVNPPIPPLRRPIQVIYR